jgi:hypothetical protein
MAAINARFININGAECAIDAAPAAVEWTFEGGLAPIAIAIDGLSESIINAAIAHGLKQKVGDAAALSRNPETGRSATTADKRAAMLEVIERLIGPAPSWNKTERDGTGPTGGLLWRAMVRAFPEKDGEKLRAWIASKSDKEQANMRAQPKISAIIAEIKAEDAARAAARAAAKGTTAPDDAADPFAGLDDIE